MKGNLKKPQLEKDKGSPVFGETGSGKGTKGFQTFPKLVEKIFINRDFGLLFLGRLVSQIGDGIHYFAMSWLVLDMTGSGAALGTLLILASLPGLILTPFTGVLSDMLDRKKIIVSMDGLRGGIQLGLGFFYLGGMLTLPLLYGATVVLSMCGALFGPAISAAVPGLVKKEQLVQANARDSFSFSATGIVGPLAGALLLGSFGYAMVFFVNGASFLISAVSELFIQFPQVKGLGGTGNRKTKTSGLTSWVQFLGNLKEGFGFLWKNPGLRIIMIGGVLLNTLLNPVFAVLFPFFGKEVLGMSAQNYGISQSVLPVGAVLGALLVSGIAARIYKTRLVVGSVIVQGLIIASLGLVALPMVSENIGELGKLVGFSTPLLFLGFFNVLVGVPINVMMQELVPDGFRGRVFSLFGSSMNMLTPLAMGIFGVLLDYVPMYFFFFLCGCAAILIAVCINRSKALHAVFQPPAFVISEKESKNKGDSNFHSETVQSIV